MWNTVSASFGDKSTWSDLDKAALELLEVAVVSWPALKREAQALNGALITALSKRARDLVSEPLQKLKDSYPNNFLDFCLAHQRDVTLCIQLIGKNKRHPEIVPLLRDLRKLSLLLQSVGVADVHQTVQDTLAHKMVPMSVTVKSAHRRLYSSSHANTHTHQWSDRMPSPMESCT